MPDPNRVQELLADASELPPEDRAAYLDSACAGDGALRAEVESLLRSQDEAGRFLSSPTADSAQSDEPATADSVIAAPHAAHLRERVGSSVGPYKLLQLIGEGGFGSVFMAEQSKPVSRKVALKVIKLGMDTRQVVARFEQERQALAIMDHPNIAKVFDAGATENGRPYFVMELCTGMPISQYCDKHNLSIEDRLELFAQVCLAVQHAHTKGVIHRDIKPTNVLVSTHDGRPHAKVIDFGIAKATASKLTEKTLFTEHRQLIGTPEYMSPEQAEGSLDIDTRTDVYSLGVLLYELLTGSTPFSGSKLRSAAFGEIQRIIREVDPPKPSTRLNQSSDGIAGIAASRHTDPRRLGAVIRGELDWIVMKALEKDRSRRYDTPSGLAADIRRYIAGETVAAAPPSAVYRARKFVRKNKGVVTAVGAVTLALLVGVIAFAWQAEAARAQRDLAIAAQQAEAEQRRVAAEQRDRAVAAEVETKQRAEELADVSDFQARMLSQIDPAQAGAALMTDIRARFDAAMTRGDLTDAERAARAEAFWGDLSRVNATDAAQRLIDTTMLKPAVSAIDAEFQDQPLVDARLRTTLANVNKSLGMLEDARALQERALAIRRHELGDDDPFTLEAIMNLGDILGALGRMRDAEPYLLEAYEGTRRVLGADDLESIKTASNLGNHYRAMGRYDDAEPLLRTAVETARRVLGNDHRNTLIAINSYGYLLIMRGKLAEAEPLWREVYETGRRAFSDDDPDVFVWINNYAGLIEALGRAREAESFFRESLEKHLRVRGENHPATIVAFGSLARNLSRQGRFPESEQLFREALEKSRNTLGPEHMNTLSDTVGLGALLMRQGKLADAEVLLRFAYEARRRTLGVEHTETINALAQLALLLQRQERISEAEAAFRTCIDVSTRTLGADHPDTLILFNNFANLLLSADRLEEAEPIVRNALDARRRVSGVDHPETLVAMATLAFLLERREKYDEAELVYRDAVQRFRRVLGDEHPNTLTGISNLANLLRLQRQTDEAERLFQEAAEAFTRVLGRDHARTATARVGLGVTLGELGRHREGAAELLEGVRAFAASVGVDSPRYKRAVRSLIDLYTAWDKVEPDAAHAAAAAEWGARIAEPQPSPNPTP